MSASWQGTCPTCEKRLLIANSDSPTPRHMVKGGAYCPYDGQPKDVRQDGPLRAQKKAKQAQQRPSNRWRQCPECGKRIVLPVDMAEIPAHQSGGVACAYRGTGENTKFAKRNKPKSSAAKTRDTRCRLCKGPIGKGTGSVCGVCKPRRSRSVKAILVGAPGLGKRS